MPQTLPILLAVFVLALLLEHAARARPALEARAQRTRVFGTLGLLAIGSILTRLLVPAGLAGVALWASSAGLGLFNQIALPGFVAIILAWIALDFAIWVQHVAMHRVPVLWRLHRVHHADTTMDVFTAFRFHPLELLVSLGWKAAVVVALGAPLEAVILFEIGLSAAAMVNHANIRLPEAADGLLSRVLATPAFHLVHHHPDPAFTNSHYGNVLSVWDHAFGLGGPAPAGSVRIGLDRPEPDNSPKALLLEPFGPE